MWNQDNSWSPFEMKSPQAEKSKTDLHILPCTVSQLLSASQYSSGSFTICNRELDQVSVVGIVRGIAPFVTNIQYSVDDMTGPPLNVKQWVNEEDCALMSSVSPGSYVKAIGRLRSFNGQRSLQALHICCIKDLNEITSHMLAVVHAHMDLFGKAFDVNMNTTAASISARFLGQSGNRDLKSILPKGLSTIQGEVLHIIRRFSTCNIGISFQELQNQLDYLSTADIRNSLTFLLNEGHAFCTIDEQHFKSTEH